MGKNPGITGRVAGSINGRQYMEFCQNFYVTKFVEENVLPTLYIATIVSLRRVYKYIKMTNSTTKECKYFKITFLTSILKS